MEEEHMRGKGMMDYESHGKKGPKVKRTKKTTRVKRNPPKGKVGDGSW